MSELTQALQKARQDKGMSLTDIQEITKIQRRYLEAIEAGNFDVLPGHFYARAFIKNYAEAVGLDSEKLLSEYGSELPSPPKVEEAPTPLRQSRQPRKEGSDGSGKWMSRVLLYLFVILVLVVIGGAIKWLNGQNAAPQAPTQKTQPSTPAADKSKMPVPPPEKAVVPKPATPAPAPQPTTDGKLTPAPKTGSTINYDLTGAQTVKVKVTVKTGAHWMSIGNENGMLDQATLNEGESRDFEVKEGSEVRLSIVRARDVDVLVNGQPVDTSGARKSGSQKIKIVRK